VDRTWLDLLILAYAAATGFVASGIVSSFYQMVTTHPAKFGLFGNSFAAWMLTFVFCALTGPFIIMRNGIRGHFKERKPVQWLLASLLVAGIWSSCSGLIVLNFALVSGLA
jgi:hypothetical protein